MALLLPLFISCAADIRGTVYERGSAELSLEAALEPATAALIRSFSGRFGGSSTSAEPLIDGAAVSRSMEAAPGIESVSLRNRSPVSLEGTIKISRLQDFLSFPNTSPGNREQFITYSQDGSGGSLRIRLDLAAGPDLLLLLSEDIRDYLSALMAPAATGEILSKAEYLELVSSVYGRGVAAEISGARMNLELTMPGPVTSVRGGSFSGRMVRFQVPVLELLVLENVQEYEIRWKK